MKVSERTELRTLEGVLKGVERDGSHYVGMWTAIFGLIGVALLTTVCFLYYDGRPTFFWVYFLSVLGGAHLCGAGVMNGLGRYFRPLTPYIDREAIRKRIEELQVKKSG